MDIFWHELWHATKETLIIIPILYLAYLLVSYFSHNNNEKYAKVLHYTNKAGPVIGAFLGCIPQCGFSSVMSQLYSKKIITLGTLIAVFIATSDEALPLMISKPEFIPDLLILMAVKVVYGIIVGYIIDGIYTLYSKRNKVLVTKDKPKKQKTLKLKKHKKEQQSIEIKDAEISGEKQIATEENSQISSAEIEESDKLKELVDEQKENAQMDHELENIDYCGCGHSHHHEHHCHHEKEEKGGHKHSHDHCCATNIFLDALQHTAIIVAYVFIATLAINLISGYCGGLEPLQKFFTDNVFVQIVVASLIGLIPNCAASVFIVELFMANVLYFPALVAGLSAGAGVGLIVLYTANYKKIGANISITILQYALAVLIGIITNFLPIW